MRFVNIANLTKSLVIIGFIGFILVLVPTIVPKTIGANEARVCLGGSMEPSIKVGDVVFTKDVEAADIHIGDIISFHTKSGIVIHRVTEEAGDSFNTKGDANEEQDNWIVPSKAVKGRFWFRIPYIGFLLFFAKSNMFLLMVIVGGSVIASRIWDSYEIIKNSNRTETVHTETNASSVGILQRIADAYYYRGAWYHDVFTGSGYRKWFRHENEDGDNGDQGSEVNTAENIEMQEREELHNNGENQVTTGQEQIEVETEIKDKEGAGFLERMTVAYRFRGVWWRDVITGSKVRKCNTTFS